MKHILMGVIKFKSNGMLYINVAKQRVQNHFHNKSTSDLTLLVDIYGCYMRYDLKTENLSTKYYFIFTIWAITASSRGHMLMSSILCKNRILMVHPLILFRIC